MAFLGAIPLLAGAAGATLPTALAIGLPALSGAFGLASGIARGDPISAILSGAEGALGGLGGAGALGGLSGATSAASASPAAAPVLQAGESAVSNMAPIAQGATNVIEGLPDISGVLGSTSNATGMPQLIPEISTSASQAFLAPASMTKSMSTMDMIGTALQGAGAATQGVMGLIDSFRDKTKVSPMSFGAINNYLPSMQAGNLGELPRTPQIESSVMQTPYNLEFGDNEMFYRLMGAYQG